MCGVCGLPTTHTTTIQTMAVVSSLVFFTATFVWVYIFLTSLWLKQRLRLLLDRLFPTPTTTNISQPSNNKNSFSDN